MRDSKMIERLKEGIRKAALHRLFGPGFGLSDVQPPPTAVAALDDTWLVKIVISSEPVRIQFKVYYTVELAKTLFHLKNSRSSPLPPRMYHDFMREFCNLTAGAVKVWLAELFTIMKPDDLVVNLPDQKPALIEAPPLGKKDEESTLYDSWLFSSDDYQLLCATELQVFDWSQVANIQHNSEVLENAGGSEIEFL